MIEKIFFTTLAIAIFTITFLKLIKKNDTTYIYVLVIEFIGIAINFIELLLSTSFSWGLKLIMYLFSIILPIILFVIERIKKVELSELLITIKVPILEKLGKTEKAKTILTNYLNKNQNSYAAHKLLAQIYMKQENYDLAVNEYIRVTELGIKNIEDYYKLSVALNKNKQNEEAISMLQEIIKKAPENEKYTNLLGEIYFEQEKYKEAASVYMSSLRYHPGSFDLYYSLGMAYTMLNDFQKAKEFYEKAAEVNSLAYNAKLNLGQIALIYGDLDEAEKYFRESLKQNDLESGSYYYLSQIALLKGDEDKAKNYMNVAIQLNPRVYKQMQKDPLFTPIREAVKPPQEVIEEAKQEIEKTLAKEVAEEQKIDKNLTKEVAEEQEKDKNIVNEEPEERKQQISSLTKKEIKVNKHLSKMCMLVENLSGEDIQIIKKMKEKQLNKEEKQKE